ncbi:hypothetical protein [uncultured Sphingomonas sp.]|uniref:hypothetical protein n=1 Tax=uncultured Sphingomonas sp. TaxID=158754 RepID=UPI0025FF2DD8|nr:hypothetical protein [uncultured Sphingomonas sp.]
MILSTDREAQRVEHLVLGRPRPTPAIGPKPKGMSKQEWRAAKSQIRARGTELLPGIEERVKLAEAFGGRQGTPETIASLEHRQRRSGTVARLYATKALDADQLAAADKIATTYRAVTADAPFRTASWETRTGGGVGGGDIDIALLGATLGEYALSWWLGSIRQPDAIVAIVVHDLALTTAADRYALSVPRLRKLLGEALTTWWRRYGRGEVVGS